MRGAHFYCTLFLETVFSEADLTGVDLGESWFIRSDLRATGLTQEQVKNACGRDTQLPLDMNFGRACPGEDEWMRICSEKSPGSVGDRVR